ncbi:MAG: GtrA family protein [Bacteroidales bacterium]|nr:GtrA family protein [Bacteroidales bacterium]MBO4566084.1 GtrA family protein [Bacteroidales bacterium]
MSAHRRINTLFRAKTASVWVQLLRYGISGLSATILDFVVLTLLTELFGEKLLLVWTAIAFLSGLTLTYLLSTNWVFDVRRLKSRTAEVSVFLLIGAIGLALTEFLMWLFAHQMDLHYLLSKLFASLIVFLWNFTAKKFILFRR